MIINQNGVLFVATVHTFSCTPVHAHDKSVCCTEWHVCLRWVAYRST